MVHQAIIDHTGVDLSLNYVSDNVEQKFSLLVTGDTIPDISVLTYDMYMEYAKQGAFYDITDLVDKYPNLMKYVPEAYWESVKVDGKIMVCLRLMWKENIIYTSGKTGWRTWV